MSLSKCIKILVTVLFLGYLQHKLHAFPMIVVFMDAFIFYVLLMYYDLVFLSIFILADVTKDNFALIGVIGTYPFCNMISFAPVQ